MTKTAGWFYYSKFIIALKFNERMFGCKVNKHWLIHWLTGTQRLYYVIGEGSKIFTTCSQPASDLQQHIYWTEAQQSISDVQSSEKGSTAEKIIILLS